MQSDPNWSNFIYNLETKTIHLIDFGATREYDKDFIDVYFALLYAASINETATCLNLSKQLGFLTGYETETMKSAHLTSLIALAEPFSSRFDVYDFEQQDITKRVTDLVPVMLKERLTPPPDESYSIHRKLSGLFLLCGKIGAKVPCHRIFEEFRLKKIE